MGLGKLKTEMIVGQKLTIVNDFETELPFMFILDKSIQIIIVQTQ